MKGNFKKFSYEPKKWAEDDVVSFGSKSILDGSKALWRTVEVEN